MAVVSAPGNARAAGWNETTLSRFSWGVGAAVCTLGYTPVKVVYAVATVPIAGLVYLLSVGDAETTKQLLMRAGRGDYVVTPEHLRRERPLLFFGKPAAND